MDRIPMAESNGIGWRLQTESGGGMNRNRVAACAGIRNRRIFMESVPCIPCKKRDDEWEAQNKLDPVFDKEYTKE